MSRGKTSDAAGNNVLVDYEYDKNGSMVYKNDHVQTKEHVYTYNLQGKLSSMQLYYPPFTETIYKYDADGIRVQKNVGDEIITDYLIDPSNHTGYAQVLVEDNGTDKTAYIIGDDVLAQATGNAADAPKYLLYDGHGSTRQLTNTSGTVISGESYSYDGYGVLLGGPRATQTNLLYTGEQYDTSADMYYLRARYYDPLNGRFNQTDPFAGNNQDPQSLHKYLYCHANPVNCSGPRVFGC